MLAAFYSRLRGGDLRENITDTYIITMLLIFPLFTGFSGYTSITISKYIFFVSATVIWILALATATLITKSGFGRLSAAQASAILFMSVCCISTLLSPMRVEALIGAGRYDGLVTLLLYGCVFLGVSAYTRPKPVFSAVLAVSVTLCCIVSALQLFDIDILRLFPEGYSYYDSGVKYTSRFLGTIGNVDVLMSLLCLSLPLFFGVFVAGSGKKTWFYLFSLFVSGFVFFASRVSAGFVGFFVCALLGAPLVLTDMRRVRRALAALALFAISASAAFSFSPVKNGDFVTHAFQPSQFSLLCLIAAASCLILMLIFSLMKDFAPSAKVLRLFFSIASFTALAALLVSAYLFKGSEGTFYEFSQLLHGNIENSFGSHRILIWREVLALVPERPLFGGGPDTLALRLDLQFSRFVEATGKTLSVSVDNAHNEYLGYLVNTGILGLVSYLSVLACSFLSLLKLPRCCFGCGLLLAVICYCTQSFFSIGLCLVAPLFWVFLGLAANRRTSLMEQ